MHLEGFAPAQVERLRTTACCAALARRGSFRPGRANRSLQEIAWGGKAKLARMSREQARAHSPNGWATGRSESRRRADDPAGNGFPRVRRLCHNRCRIHGNGISCLMTETHHVHGCDRAGESLRAFTAETDSAGKSPRRRGGCGRCAARHDRHGSGPGGRLRGGHPVRRDRRGPGRSPPAFRRARPCSRASGRVCRSRGSTWVTHLATSLPRFAARRRW